MFHFNLKLVPCRFDVQFRMSLQHCGFGIATELPQHSCQQFGRHVLDHCYWFQRDTLAPESHWLTSRRLRRSCAESSPPERRSRWKWLNRWLNKHDANGILFHPNSCVHGGTDHSTQYCIQCWFQSYISFIFLNGFYLLHPTPTPITTQANTSIWIDYPHWW